FFGNVKLIFGERGFDFNDESDAFNYGGNIYRVENDRPFENGHEAAQGNTTSVFYGEVQGGYLINPSTNLKVYASLIYRDYNPNAQTILTLKNSTMCLNFVIYTDIFNRYFDY